MTSFRTGLVKSNGLTRKVFRRLLGNKLPIVYDLRAGYANDCAQSACTLSGVEG